ncbi:hypothetical protein N7462_002289 [Penicillium macrosclerotiorum]|uniref:uncharacterized protein n=1 Tax=Penicillium macrosclerotiorum TaxID=303699 RepID=UPI00254851EC|nr:uncharacterized protein N7462_002289 [Penicillium macrosclerotiorum]KAJ5692866.1 hypothetical protein N7462_002289 [Penicillium macrosclerotiorum]
MSQFHLFPSPSLEVKAAKNPFRKGVKRPMNDVQPSSPLSLEATKESAKTESVLLQIIEDTRRIPPPPALPAPDSRPRTPSLPEASANLKSSSPPRTDSRQSNKPCHRALPSQASSNTNSSSDAHTVGSGALSQSSKSSAPPEQMRSMFPRLDSKFLPAMHDHTPKSNNSTSPPMGSHNVNLMLAKSPETSSPDIDHVLGPKTVPASVLNFPTGFSEPEEIRYSSKEELETLWEAANGQRPQSLVGKFHLRLRRTGPATFTFGDSEQPFYTLQTYSNDELAISRAMPSKPNSNVPIMTLSLEKRTRRDQPNDGLVALLFSRLAAMLAIDEAGELSKLHKFDPSEAADIEKKVLKRAAAEESCRLSWNCNSRLYELRHPSLSKRQPPALVGAAGIPLSPVRSQSSGLLHITVSAPSSHFTPHQPPTIIVTGPMSSTAFNASQQAANVRTSTLPLSDSDETDEPLASLDFATRTLSISPAAIIETIPSLYAIDSLIAAMLAVAVSDEVTNPILADMVLGSPALPEERKVSEPAYGLPFRGQLITTLAEREDYAESLHLASQIEASNFKAERESKNKGFFQFWNNSKSSSRAGSRSSKKNQEVVIEEFDLEKYGRYGKSSSRKDEKLPSITRTLLKVLFFGLNLIVKGLTLLVKLLAWLVVKLTQCVTSEKF